jgi:hypothetical protein
MEKDQKEESIHALRNLVLLVGSLTTCGFLELKPSSAMSSGSLFQMPGFTIPQPTGKGRGSGLDAKDSVCLGQPNQAVGQAVFCTNLPDRQSNILLFC